MFTQSSTGIISFTAPFSPGRLCVVPVCNIAGANPFGITICIFGSSVVIVVSLSAKPLPSTLGVSSGPPPEPPPISFSFLSKVSFIYSNTSLSLFAAF